MKDFLGRDIKIGDNVVHARTIGRSCTMTKNTVVGFTNCMVRVTGANSSFYIRNEEPSYTHLANPNNLIVYTPIGE